MIVRKHKINEGITPIIEDNKIVDLKFDDGRTLRKPDDTSCYIDEYVASDGNTAYLVKRIHGYVSYYVYENQYNDLGISIGGNVIAKYFNKETDELFIVSLNNNGYRFYSINVSANGRVHNSRDNLSLPIISITEKNNCNKIIYYHHMSEMDKNVIDKIERGDCAICCLVGSGFGIYSSNKIKEYFLLGKQEYNGKQCNRIFSTDGGRFEYSMYFAFYNGFYSIYEYGSGWIFEDDIKCIFYKDYDYIYIGNDNNKVNLILHSGLVSSVWCDAIINISGKNNGPLRPIFKYEPTKTVFDPNCELSIASKNFKIKSENVKYLIDSARRGKIEGLDGFLLFNDGKIGTKSFVYLRETWYDDMMLSKFPIRAVLKNEYLLFVSLDGKYNVLCGHRTNGEHYLFDKFVYDVHSIHNEVNGDYYLVTEDKKGNYTLWLRDICLSKITGIKTLDDGFFLLRNTKGEFTIASYYDSDFVWAKRIRCVYTEHPIFVIDDDGDERTIVAKKERNSKITFLQIN